jgi:hypothetical protein
VLARTPILTEYRYIETLSLSLSLSLSLFLFRDGSSTVEGLEGSAPWSRMGASVCRDLDYRVTLLIRNTHPL